VIGFVAVVVAAFVVMEPLTYAAHRFVMHGIGMRLHRSHHRRWPSRRAGDPFFEANDAFPVIFAGATMVAIAVGFNVDGLAVLLPLALGATLYGVAYAFVHDGYIHGRVPVRRRHRRLDRLAEAHALHHRFGGEPFGMLLPVVPRTVRDRAEDSESAQRVGAVPGP